MFTYPGAITLSERALVFLAGLLQAHREQLRTWRKLSASVQALLVLAHLRHGDTYQRLAVGFGVGVATVYRYVREAVGLLAALGRSLLPCGRWPGPPATSRCSTARWCAPTGSTPATGCTTAAVRI